MRCIASHYLLDRGQILARPLLTVDDRGRILAVEQWESLDRLHSTEFYAGALCAGFVNAHCHIELSYLRGAIPRGTGFGGFARAIGQVRGGFSAEERARALVAADAWMWQVGVAAVADIVNGATSFEMKRRSPIRYRSFAELFGLRSNVESVEELLQHPQTTITPHSTYSLQDGPFRLSAAMAAGAPLSIHFMESEDEQALFDGSGSLAAWYERMGWQCDFLHYGSPARRLTESLEREQRLLLIHACCVGEAELQLLNDHFINPIAWVLCPRSNDYISSLRPPMELLRSWGAMICVGTDSLASNESLSIVEELKCFVGVPLKECLAWATINGARALGLEAELGSVEVGKCPGIVLLEGLDMSGSEPQLTASTTARRLI